MLIVPANLEDVTEKTIGCAIAVHRAIGPGVLESVYRECLLVELRATGIQVESERQVPIVYRGRRLATPLKMDLLVGDCVVVEVKAVEKINPVFLAQVITYLKLAEKPAGLLMNFHAQSLRAGLRRLTHPDLYTKKTKAASHP